MPENKYPNQQEDVNSVLNSFLRRAEAKQLYSGDPLPVKLTMPGHVGKFFGEAYNRSVWGLSDQLITGEQRADLSGYEYGTLFDVGATIASLVMDLPTFFVGGSVAKVGVKGIAKAVGKKRVKSAIDSTSKILSTNKANPGYIGRVRNELNNTFLINGERLVAEAGGLGIVSGTHDMLYQKITKDDWDFAQSVNASLLGAASIGLSKFTGPAAANVVGKTAPSAIKKGLQFGGEIVGFTAPYTFQQGKLLPSPHDLAHTAAVLGGAKLVFRGIAGISKGQTDLINETNKLFGNKDSIKYKDIDKQYQDLAKKELEQKRGIELGKKESFYDNDGNLIEKISESRKIGAVKFRRGNSEKIETLDVETFYNDFKIQNSIKSPRTVLVRNIAEKLKDLGVREDIDAVRRTVFQIRGGRVPENLGKKDTGLGSLTNRELYALNKKLDSQVFLDNTAREFAILDKVGKAHIPGPFAFISNVLDNLTKNTWMRSPESKVYRENVNPIGKKLLHDVESYTSLKGMLLTQMLGRLKKTGVFRNAHNKEAMKKLTEELEMNDGVQPTMSNVAKEMRSIYNDLYSFLTKEGIPVDAFVKNYAPHYLKKGLFHQLRELRDNILYEKPELRNGIEKLETNPDTVLFLERKFAEIIHKNKGKDVANYLESLTKFEKGGDKVFSTMDKHLISQAASKPFFLKGRTAKIEWVEKEGYKLDIFETDGLANMIQYAEQASELIARKRFFGEKYEKAIKTIDTVRAGEGKYGADVATSNVLGEVISRVSGAIENDHMRNLPPKMKKFASALTDFQVATKIGGGLATLVNVTQPLISSLFLGNYRVGIPSYIKRFVSPGTKRTLADMGLFKESKMIDTIEVLTGKKSRGDTALERIADSITKASGFQGINRINATTSASIGMDMMQYLNNIANRKEVLLKGVPIPKKLKQSIINDTLAGQNRTAWAKRKLFRDFGIIWKGKENLSFGEISRGAIKFARDTQLQRNYVKEPIFLTDPRFRPLWVLKTFGIKQAKLIKDGLTKEVGDGNILPILRLSIGAGIGGKFIINSYEMIQNILSGKDEYDWRQAKQSFEEMRPGFFTGKRNYTKSDYWLELLTPTIDELAAVGTMGVVTDFMSAENKMQSLGWALKPVIGVM